MAYRMLQLPSAFYGSVRSYPIHGIQESMGEVADIDAIDLEALERLTMRCVGGHYVKLELKMVPPVVVEDIALTPSFISATGNGVCMSWWPEGWTGKIDPDKLAEAMRRQKAKMPPPQFNNNQIIDCNVGDHGVNEGYGD